MRSGYPDDDIDPGRVPGLARLDRAVVEAVLEVGRLVHIPDGWTPIHADEPSDEAYLILDGCVEVVDDGETIADVCRGEFAGEMGLVEGALRSARVTVTEPVLAIAWPREDFQALREEHPDFDELVSQVARQRVKRNEQRAQGA